MKKKYKKRIKRIKAELRHTYGVSENNLTEIAEIDETLEKHMAFIKNMQSQINELKKPVDTGNNKPKYPCDDCVHVNKCEINRATLNYFAEMSNYFSVSKTSIGFNCKRYESSNS